MVPSPGAVFILGDGGIVFREFPGGLGFLVGLGVALATQFPFSSPPRSSPLSLRLFSRFWSCLVSFLIFYAHLKL